MNSIETVFTNIVRTWGWSQGSSETPCGPGSSLSATEPIVRKMPEWFKECDISSIADLGCGDFHWMSRVDLTYVRYDGFDIIKFLIEEVHRKYARPGKIRFHHADILEAPTPRVDLVICKDVLNHLPVFARLGLLVKIRASGSRFLAANSFPGHSNREGDIPFGGWQKLDLVAPPYSLGDPLKMVWTAEPEPRLFALWKLT